MRTALIALVLAALVSTALAEDVLVLENGREARGRIVDESESGVNLEIGGGTMFYPKRLIKEVRRGVADNKAAATAAGADPVPDASQVREEFSLLYRDGRRAGTRVVRAVKTQTGYRFEEETMLLDDAGAPREEQRITEYADAEFRPLTMQVRRSGKDLDATLVAAEVRGGRVFVTTTQKGDKKQRDEAVPDGGRFPFGAREKFLRESKSIGGRLAAPVLDAKSMTWLATVYAEDGRKLLLEKGATADLRVVLRKSGEVTEHEWVDDQFRAHMSELEGEVLRAMACDGDAVTRVRKGDTERVTGPDSSAKTRYVDAAEGWQIGKPDPSWTFEAPATKTGGTLLSIRNTPLFASVDVLCDGAAARDMTPERAAETLKRVCRSIAPDFAVVSEGWRGEGAARVYWCEATATTKGEKTRTLANVLIRKGRVYRLLAACPDGAYVAAKPEFEKILASFAVE